MPEACFVCLDSTEYLRNGDQFPNRLMAEQEAANLLVNAKMQANAENMVGLLVTGGVACTVYETLTPDVDRVMASISKMGVRGGVCHFVNGLLIASLALTHRTNPRAEKRIVAFVASPLQHVSDAELDRLARRLRRDDVAVDVVAFGVDDNAPLLRRFVERVGRQGNSRFLHVPGTTNLIDALMSSPILLIGDDAVMAAEGGGGGGAEATMTGGGGSAAALGGFAVDPNVDPELAMAIRLSMEEEHQRQAAAAAAAATNNNNNATTAATAATTAPPPSSPPRRDANAAAADDDDNMSDDEMLQRALQLSLQEAGQGTATTTTTTRRDGNNATEQSSSSSQQQQRRAGDDGDDEEAHSTTTTATTNTADATASQTTAIYHDDDEEAAAQARRQRQQQQQQQQQHDDNAGK